MRTPTRLQRARRLAGSPRRRSSGVMSVELAFLLPLLLALSLPIYDVARNIQAQMILINVSREGANLASRASTVYPMQSIMNSLTATTPPLDMASRGMIYITQIMGNNNCDANGNNCTGIVVGQWRWNNGGYHPSSGLWNCGGGGTSWASDGTGACNGIPGPGKNSPTVATLNGQLSDGQIAYVVEAFYLQPQLIQAMSLGNGVTTPSLSPNLYAMTVF
ncbi:MAG TPA: TadE/TadG family type IV pilus assembly protein [Pararobbsia sp.]|nr:TadE/TadG family type IV pilus assembly protein [Pararobbsia sp.]